MQRYWQIPRQRWDHTDSREVLEIMGFNIKIDTDPLCYDVEPPRGWTQQSFTHCWINVYNDENREVFQAYDNKDTKVAYIDL